MIDVDQTPLDLVRHRSDAREKTWEHKENLMSESQQCTSVWLRVHRRASVACRRREGWGIDGPERGAQGTTSSGHLGGYTGSHLPPGPAVQAVTTRTSTGGGEKSRTSVEHTNTNDLGLER